MLPIPRVPLVALLAAASLLIGLVAVEAQLRRDRNEAVFAEPPRALGYSDDNVTVMAVNFRFLPDRVVRVPGHLAGLRPFPHFYILHPEQEAEIIAGRTPSDPIFEKRPDEPVGPWFEFRTPPHVGGPLPPQPFWNRSRVPAPEPPYFRADPAFDFVFPGSVDFVWVYRNTSANYERLRDIDYYMRVDESPAHWFEYVDSDTELAIAWAERASWLMAAAIAASAVWTGVQVWRGRGAAVALTGVEDVLRLAARGNESLRILRYVVWISGALAALSVVLEFRSIQLDVQEWNRLGTGPPLSFEDHRPLYLIGAALVAILGGLAWVGYALEREYRRRKDQLAKPPSLD